jgi:peroxiredoxin Q/BCP
MARSPQVGEPAPDFELPGTNGDFRLSDHRGERVVLLFYPGDNTPVCTRQFCSYRDDSQELDALDATIVGISGQGVESHEEFTAKHGLTVPLLADTDHAVARAYGAHQSVIGTRRAVIIVDEQGKVAFRHDHALGLSYMSAAEIGAELAKLPERV